LSEAPAHQVISVADIHQQKFSPTKLEIMREFKDKPMSIDMFGRKTDSFNEMQQKPSRFTIQNKGYPSFATSQPTDASSICP